MTARRKRISVGAAACGRAWRMRRKRRYQGRHQRVAEALGSRGATARHWADRRACRRVAMAGPRIMRKSGECDQPVALYSLISTPIPLYALSEDRLSLNVSTSARLQFGAIQLFNTEAYRDSELFEYTMAR